MKSVRLSRIFCFRNSCCPHTTCILYCSSQFSCVVMFTNGLGYQYVLYSSPSLITIVLFLYYASIQFAKFSLSFAKTSSSYASLLMLDSSYFSQMRFQSASNTAMKETGYGSSRIGDGRSLSQSDCLSWYPIMPIVDSQDLSGVQNVTNFSPSVSGLVKQSSEFLSMQYPSE